MRVGSLLLLLLSLSQKSIGLMIRLTGSRLPSRLHGATTRRTFPDLPGLVLEPDFLSKDLHDVVFEQTKQASLLAQELAQESNLSSVVSPAHNVPIRAEYVPVKVPLEGFFDTTTTRSAEHFGSYGEGHRLTYYRGNHNIPRLGLAPDLLEQLAARPIIDQEIRESRSRTKRRETANPTWKLTLNYYPNDQGGRVGFPWHRDLEANGASTMILGLGSPGQLEFGKEPNFDMSSPAPPKEENRVLRPDLVEPVQAITLEPGSLLILTGPARWHFVHRVLPNNSKDGERASLVYGVW